MICIEDSTIMNGKEYTGTLNIISHQVIEIKVIMDMPYNYQLKWQIKRLY